MNRDDTGKGILRRPSAMGLLGTLALVGALLGYGDEASSDGATSGSGGSGGSANVGGASVGGSGGANTGGANTGGSGGTGSGVPQGGAPPVDFPNRPPGLTDLFTESFEYEWQGTDGSPPGWSEAGIWLPANAATVDDPNAPDGNKALRTQVQDGVMAPGGAMTAHRDLGGAYSRLYIAFFLRFEPGFHHNGAIEGDLGSGSEKIMSLNFYTDAYLFQYHWGAEALMNIAPAPEDVVTPDDLHANLMSKDQFDNFIAPIPPDDVWTLYEIYIEVNTGTVQWWTNGEPRAHHVGRSVNPITDIALNDTWGGGGIKQGTEGRLVDHIVVAGAL